MCRCKPENGRDWGMRLPAIALWGMCKARLKLTNRYWPLPRPKTNGCVFNLGLLYADVGEQDRALEIWQHLINEAQGVTRSTAEVLMGLWADPPQLLPDAETFD